MNWLMFVFPLLLVALTQTLTTGDNTSTAQQTSTVTRVFRTTLAVEAV